MNPLPFSGQAKTRSVSVTTTASTSAALPSLGNSLRVISDSANTVSVFISIGAGTQTATVPTTTPVATCTPVLAGSDVCFSIPNDAVYNISAITSTGTATIYVSVGEGQ